MAPSLKIIITFFLAITMCSLTCTEGRSIHANLDHIETNTVMSRLKLDDNSTSCWESLFKLQACTGELIQFFYNGETYMGPECCHAVHVIVHDCWPSMLSSLGFTSQEGDILRVYCDAEATQSGPNSSSRPHHVDLSKVDHISVNKINEILND